MTPQELEVKIKQNFKNAQIGVKDLTGTQNHYSVTVVSESFENVLPIRRHRMINDLLRKELASGEIHALQLTTIAPSEQ